MKNAVFFFWKLSTEMPLWEKINLKKAPKQRRFLISAAPPASLSTPLWALLQWLLSARNTQFLARNPWPRLAIPGLEIQEVYEFGYSRMGLNLIDERVTVRKARTFLATKDPVPQSFQVYLALRAGLWKWGDKRSRNVRCIVSFLVISAVMPCIVLLPFLWILLKNRGLLWMQRKPSLLTNRLFDPWVLDPRKRPCWIWSIRFWRKCNAHVFALGNLGCRESTWSTRPRCWRVVSGSCAGHRSRSRCSHGRSRLGFQTRWRRRRRRWSGWRLTEWGRIWGCGGHGICFRAYQRGPWGRRGVGRGQRGLGPWRGWCLTRSPARAKS